MSRVTGDLLHFEPPPIGTAAGRAVSCRNLVAEVISRCVTGVLCALCALCVLCVLRVLRSYGPVVCFCEEENFSLVLLKSRRRQE